MSELEKNIACAEECGWTRIEMAMLPIASGKALLNSRDALQGTPLEDRDKEDDDQRFEVIPNFSSDWNTRPIMWAAMTEKERHTFLIVLCNDLKTKDNEAIRLLHFDQPTFRDTFLKVKGRL